MNSKTIARNTAWYGLENVIGFATSLITSIAIARTLGPAKMGYIVYVTWIVTVTSSLGSVGIPATTRKYMAEFLGGGDRSTARFIYLRTLIIQTVLALIATVGGVLWVLHDAPHEYRTAAILLVVSMFPSMVNFISAQANVAAEKLSANLLGSTVSTATFFIITMSTIFFHWGVLGVCSAMLSMRLADCLVRLVPTMRRILTWESANPHMPADLKPRMLRFAAQSVMGMLLTLVVWDRSEMFLLKHLSTDIRQLAFYSVAFGLAERLLIFPTVFAAATGASMLAQYGRDRSRLPAMTAASVRYLALTSIPVHFVAAALVGPVLLIMYGHQYAGATLVAMVAPLLGLPKAFLGPVQSLFESTDKQNYFLIATVLASFVDIGVAWYFIPSLGALGACLGSGVAQATAVFLMWGIGVKRYQIKLPWRFFAKVTGASLAAALAAYFAVIKLSALWGLVVGSVVSLVVFFGIAFLVRLLEPEDCSRFKLISASAPRVLSGPIDYAFDLLSRRATPGPTAG